MSGNWNREIVVLETTQGSARNAAVLRAIWRERLKECHAEHYKIVAVGIRRDKGDKRQ